MMTVKTKENASLLMALMAALIVAVVMTVGGMKWWIVCAVAVGVFIVMALFSLLMMKRYVAYKLKPIYSMVLSRDVLHLVDNLRSVDITRKNH